MNKKFKILAIVFNCLLGATLFYSLIFTEYGRKWMSSYPEIFILPAILLLVAVVIIYSQNSESSRNIVFEQTPDIKTRVEHSALLPIKGEFLLVENEKFEERIEIIIDTVIKALEKEDIRGVKAQENCINFNYSPSEIGVTTLNKRWLFTGSISRGEMYFKRRGNQLFAHYRFNIFEDFLPTFLFGIIFLPLFLGRLLGFKTVIVMIGSTPIFALFSYLFIKNVAVKTFEKDIQKAVEAELTLQNIIDNNEVLPEHKKLGPGALLRIALFLKNKEMTEKAKVYYAYIVEKYRNTQEAEAARQELEK